MTEENENLKKTFESINEYSKFFSDNNKDKDEYLGIINNAYLKYKFIYLLLLLFKSNLESGIQDNDTIKLLQKYWWYPEFNYSFKQNLNFVFILECFSHFEWSIRTIHEKLQPEDQAKSSYEKIISELKEKNIWDWLQKQNKKTLEDSINFIPFDKIIGKVISNIDYGSEVQNDIDFIITISKMRNTIHNNSIYKWKNKELKIDKDYILKLENNKPLMAYKNWEHSLNNDIEVWLIIWLRFCKIYKKINNWLTKTLCTKK